MLRACKAAYGYFPGLLFNNDGTVDGTYSNLENISLDVAGRVMLDGKLPYKGITEDFNTSIKDKALCPDIDLTNLSSK